MSIQSIRDMLSFGSIFGAISGILAHLEDMEAPVAAVAAEPVDLTPLTERVAALEAMLGQRPDEVKNEVITEAEADADADADLDAGGAVVQPADDPAASL